MPEAAPRKQVSKHKFSNVEFNKKNKSTHYQFNIVIDIIEIVNTMPS